MSKSKNEHHSANETANVSLSPMTIPEIIDLQRELMTWVGAQFQEVVVDGIKGEEPRSIRLGFFWTGGVRWIVFDYRVQAPLLMLFDGQDGVPMTPPKTAGKVRRPIELFLRSKHIGRRLRDVRLRPEDGRALDLVFDPNTDGSEVCIELKIYPHGRNIRALSGAQSITEFKPMTRDDGPASETVRARSFENIDPSRPPRARNELARSWMNQVKPRRSEGAPKAGAEATKSPLERKIEKRKKALEKVREEIRAKENSPAREIGEWLKAHQTLALPADWPAAKVKMVDGEKSLAENIDRLFATAKSQERKLDGTRARANEIESEIAQLEKKLARGEVSDQNVSIENGSSAASRRDLFEAAQARGRKFQVADDLIVYLGKNAAENLAILRKAQPFDLWLHLRDRPGAHAILRRNRGRVVTDAELLKAGTYVAEQTMKRRAIELRGEVFDLLVVECRFVRPIKGDRMGRVHYTGDRVLRLAL